MATPKKSNIKKATPKVTETATTDAAVAPTANETVIAEAIVNVEANDMIIASDGSKSVADASAPNTLTEVTVLKDMPTGYKKGDVKQVSAEVAAIFVAKGIAKIN